MASPRSTTPPPDGPDDPVAIGGVRYYMMFDEVIEHLKAADLLGLGFTVEAIMVPDGEHPSTLRGEYVLQLYTEPPVRPDDD